MINPKKTQSTIYITGAGPGDPGLITLKAKEILSIADVVVYDNLVSNEILELVINLNPEVKMIYGGRVGYNPAKSLEQNEINSLLVDLAKEYKVICRLKGGDPSVFGRLGEEAVYLRKERINIEIIPGVSSVTAVPSYAGIPLTHRDCSSSFTVIAAQGEADDPLRNIKWENFDARNGTLVLLMGVKKLPGIIDKLLELGRDPTTPIAIIYLGTTSRQSTFVTRLGKVNNDLMEINIKPPSLIIIGEVVNYRDILNWYETKSLFAKNVLVTRSKEQSVSFVSKLIQSGAHPVNMPLVSYEFNQKELYNKNIINNLRNYEWIFFTSQNAVKFFFEILRANYFDSRALAGIKIAAVGYKTKVELGKYNINPDFVPKKFSFDDLVKELLELENIKDKQILHPTQEESAKEPILQNLKTWNIYRAEFTTSLDPNLVNALNNGIEVITLFSSNTAKHFSQIVSKYNLDMSRSKFAVIGDETAKSVVELFGRVDIVANPSTEEGLIYSMEEYFDKARSKGIGVRR